MKVVSQIFGTKIMDYALKFCVSVLIARALGPTDKGVLTFAQLVVTWIVTVGNLGVYDANIFLLGSRRFPVAEVTASTIVISLLSGIVYAVALAGVIYCHWVHWKVGHTAVVYILACAIPFNILINNGTAVLQGLNLFKSYNAFTILTSLTGLAGVLCVIWVTNQRLVGFALVLLIAPLLNVSVLIIYWGRLTKWKLRFSRQYLKESLHYGLRGHLRVLLMLFAQMFDQFVVGTLLAANYLGWYSVAVSLSTGLIMLPDSVGIILFPRVASDQSTGAALTARACRCTILVMAVGAAVGIAFGRPAVGLLYGKKFLPAATPLYILLIAVIFQATSRILRNYMYGMGRPQLTLWSSGAAAIVTATAMYPLVKNFGMMGAAIGALSAQGVGAVVDLIMAVRLSDMPTRQFVLPQRTDLRLAAWKP